VAAALTAAEASISLPQRPWLAQMGRNSKGTVQTATTHSASGVMASE
jgi:hypothetical protein